MQILQLAKIPDNKYFSKEFLLLMETHLSYFVNRDGLDVKRATPQQTRMYIGDYFGLLSELEIPKKYHPLILRVNNLLSPADYDGEIDYVLVPNLAEVDTMVRLIDTRKV